MTIGEIHDPECCSICGSYLTTNEQFASERCLDPAHWQAAGLAPTDFYSLAIVMAARQTKQSTDNSVPPQK